MYDKSGAATDEGKWRGACEPLVSMGAALPGARWPSQAITPMGGVCRDAHSINQFISRSRRLGRVESEAFVRASAETGCTGSEMGL